MCLMTFCCKGQERGCPERSAVKWWMVQWVVWTGQSNHNQRTDCWYVVLTVCHHLFAQGEALYERQVIQASMQYNCQWQEFHFLHVVRYCKKGHIDCNIWCYMCVFKVML